MFKIGDEVVSKENHKELIAGQKYKVRLIIPQGYGGMILGLEGVGQNYYAHRFNPVVQELKVGDRVRVLPRPADFQNWVDGMNIMVGKTFPLHRIDGEKFYLIHPFNQMPYHFPRNGLELVNALPPVKETLKSLYAEAKRLNIQGRSKLNKEGLKAAIIKAAGVVYVKPPKELPLEQELRKRCGEKRENKVSHRSCFAVETEDGERFYHVDTYCHAEMNAWEFAGKVVVKVAEDILAYHNTSPNKKAHALFADWVINESVWKDNFLTKDWRTKSLLMDVNKTSSQIVGAQLCLRQAVEFPAKLNAWEWFVNKGYPKDVAWFMAQGIGYLNGGWVFQTMDGGHSLVYTYMKEDDVMAFFRKGVYINPGKKSYKNAIDDRKYRIHASMVKDINAGNLRDFFLDNIKKVGGGWGAGEKFDETSILALADKVAEKMYV